MKQPETPSKKSTQNLAYTGERLVAEAKYLAPQRTENLARFNYFSRLVRSGKILDFGCGSGEGAHFLCQTGPYRVTAMDLSLEAVAYAQSHYRHERLTFLCGDVLAPPLQTGLFDGIISVEVIEHLPDPERYLHQVSRRLKPDGIFMLTTPNQRISSPTPGTLWPDHIREYHSEELQALCEGYFDSVKMLGEWIPVYETNRIRQWVRKVSPKVKPLLLKWLRVRALPFLFSAIKPDLSLDEVVFTEEDIDRCPTLIAVCQGAKTAAHDQSQAT